jgi:hypothetical protein
MRLHHGGVITRNLPDSMNFYTSLGYAASAIYADPWQKARILLIQKAYEPLVKFIEPYSTYSSYMRWIQRIAIGPYHTGYEVDD